MLALLILAALPAESSEIQFQRDVLPILTKAGCNGGGCHGAAAGRGGFHLSLYGSDPAQDYQEIVQRMRGRRVNLARPEESLLLQKPTGHLDHEGGLRFDDDSPSAGILKSWIAAGAEPGPAADVESLEVFRGIHQFQKLGETVPLKAIAHFKNGISRDVTPWTVFVSSDPTALSIEKQQMTILRRGRHVATARFLDQVVAVETMLPWREEFAIPSHRVEKNFIDARIHARLDALRIPESALASDYEFLRRVYLDLTGRLPPADVIERFVADRSENKDSVLIDQLMKSEAFLDYWTFWSADLLRIHSASPDKQGIEVYHKWVREQWKNAVPYDELAASLLIAAGDSHQFGPPNFYRTAADARGQAELVSELFLGVRLRCANCHDHPLDHWKQDDYHGLAAIFANIERGRVVREGGSGEVIHPRTQTAAALRIPGTEFLKDEANPREKLADWITSPENPYFARAIANRLWKHFMGRGLVEPVDDLRDTNPPTHPELLDDLSRHLIENDFDLRSTIQLICNSAAYRRSSLADEQNEDDQLFYSHKLIKPLAAEVLADLIADATGQPHIFQNQPAGTRAIQLSDSSVPSKSLDLLGRCDRRQSCEEGGAASGLARELHLINGPLINARLTAKEGRLQESLGLETEEFIKTWYLRTLCRPPAAEERNYWTKQLNAARGKNQYAEAAEDFVWSLLVCEEFVTNH